MKNIIIILAAIFLCPFLLFGQANQKQWTIDEVVSDAAAQKHLFTKMTNFILEKL